MTKPASGIFIWCLIVGVVAFIGACFLSSQPVAIVEKPMERVWKDTELSLSSGASLEHFFEQNPDYNPSWVAKISLSEQAVLVLQRELNKKQLFPGETVDALSSSMSWWKPEKTATKFQYMTSYNSPVTVLISQAGERFDVYIEWTCP